jgi:hypothetical protein
LNKTPSPTASVWSILTSTTTSSPEVYCPLLHRRLSLSLLPHASMCTFALLINHSLLPSYSSWMLPGQYSNIDTLTKNQGPPGAPHAPVRIVPIL